MGSGERVNLRRETCWNLVSFNLFLNLNQTGMTLFSLPKAANISRLAANFFDMCGTLQGPSCKKRKLPQGEFSFDATPA